MTWSFRIARVAGIDITVHITFLLILLLGAFQWGGPHGATGALFGVLLIVLLFVCVTLHELGHALAARWFHIPVRQIILLPLGGVALLERNPSRPVHELVIALAGPLVNVLIAALLLPVIGVSAGLSGLDGRGLIEGASTPSFPTLLLWLFGANISLVVFNMIPAFPLDGGRVLRAVLAMLMPAQRATRIAVFIGQSLAIVLGTFGVLSGNLLLVLVAVFIFFGAGQENASGQARTLLTTLRVGDAYNKHALVLQVGDRMSKVVDYILTSYQPDFAVLQGGTLLGVVTRNDVLRGLNSNQGDVFVTLIMQRDVPQVAPGATLDQVRELMAAQNARVVAVFDGPAFLGLVSIEDIAEAMAVMQFMRTNQQPVAG